MRSPSAINLVTLYRKHAVTNVVKPSCIAVNQHLLLSAKRNGGTTEEKGKSMISALHVCQKAPVGLKQYRLYITCSLYRYEVTTV